jgi:hypothetical protein
MTNDQASALIKKYSQSKISKQELGSLRRFTLTNLLNSLIVLPPKEAKLWLDSSHSKLSTSKLALAIGYKTKTDNIRQSFKELVLTYETILKDKNIIESTKKTNIEISEANERKFLLFIDSRLDDETYQWPMNNKGALYRRIIWAYYLDTPPKEIKSAPSFFTRNKLIKDKLKDIDIKMVTGGVRSLDYSATCVLEEMTDTMESKAITYLKYELKKAKQEVVALREDNIKLEAQLKEVELKDEALLSKDIASFKRGCAH